MFKWIGLILFLLPQALCAQEKITPLENWSFRLDLPQGHHLPSPEYDAQVPGVVHLDLMRNNLAPDFYAGLNEHSDLAKRLESENWVYATSFEISEADLSNSKMDLVFEGIDTYAHVYLNDSLILKADNMFRNYTLSIKDLVKVGANKLRVHFTTPLNKHESDVMNAPYQLPSGNETGDMQVSAYTRKAAYQFGWDWGPRFVTCGIWKPCYISTWNDFKITNFYSQTISVVNNLATLFFQFDLESDSTYADPVVVEMMGLEFQIYVKEGKNEVKFYHQIENPKLWYPNGYGEHPIYSSNLFLRNSNTFEKIHAAKVNFAIRTIELVNEKDSIGTSFYFKVNGQPIFMKGANYIPQDLFLPRVTNDKTEYLLQLVESANMNMIRVWGGGIYESDFFYTQCDLRGILVWQDFMFANSMYPATKEFHENVAAEIEDNVKRLRNHPCIALWCGNNEIEVAWHNWGWQKQFGYSAKDSTEIWENYKAIFRKLIPDKLKQLDPSRAYIPSSPQSNWGKPENFNHGAMHYWGVWHGKEPIESFKNNVGRFMVEYGFQSYPSFDALMKTLSILNKSNSAQTRNEISRYYKYAAEAIHRDSAAFKNLQKSYIGDGLIDAEVSNYFGKIKSIEEWLGATQFIQAQALKTAIIAHRLKAPHCMGTLFWQLNDCWPGASWSVLDYYQDQKKSYAEVEKWYSPTIAILEKNESSLDLTTHSDIPFNGKVILDFNFEATDELLKTIEVAFSLLGLETKKIWSLPLKKWKKKYDLSKVSVSIYVRDMDGIIVFSDFVRFKKLGIEEI
jgi:beta-mannosidase